MKNSHITSTGDIKDPEKDQAKLQPEMTIIDMPEVKDIPGQEHVQVPMFREMADVTASSSDEEGDGLLDDLNKEDDDDADDDSGNVSASEKKLLRKSAGPQPTEETTDFNNMILDERDNEGDLLDEKSLRQERNGEDLDTPGADLDDNDENIGEEDEENNMYSQSQKD